MRLALAACVTLWLCGSLQADDGLDARLRPLIDAHKGDVAIAVKHLKTNETFQHRADEPMPTASLIKLPVMVEVYQQAHDDKLKLADAITLRKEDKVPGSGILTAHFSEGASFPLVDAVRLMIAFSDNTATNLVVDKIGLPATAARMETLGFPNTKLHSKVYKRETSVFPERSEKFGLGSTTASEMIGLLEQLHAEKLVSPEASKAMLQHLKKCDDKEKFPRLLPAETVIAHKTGSVNEARTDAGIIFSPSGPIALCVLTAKNEDKSWTAENAGNRLCATVAREVFSHFNPAPTKTP
ncbi:MAG: serine hydrolase [Planctomycetaceae bacterium]|nr:serine hydrolase [Planctomycetaceae bacterium]